MKKMLLASFLLLIFFAASCATMTTAQQAPTAPPPAAPAVAEAPVPAPNPAGGPMIQAAFASREIYPGDTWKVYIKATDPNSDMKYIVSEVSQPGYGQYPVSYTRIKGEEQKDLDGYIYLNTLIPSGYQFLNFSTLSLTVEIKDRAGHYSQPIQLALYFDPRAPKPQVAPPPGEFKDQPLGPIMVTLHPFSGSDHGGFGR